MPRATASIPCLSCLAGCCSSCCQQEEKKVNNTVETVSYELTTKQPAPAAPPALKSILKPARKLAHQDGLQNQQLLQAPDPHLTHEQTIATATATVSSEQQSEPQAEEPQKDVETRPAHDRNRASRSCPASLEVATECPKDPQSDKAHDHDQHIGRALKRLSAPADLKQLHVPRSPHPSSHQRTYAFRPLSDNDAKKPEDNNKPSRSNRLKRPKMDHVTLHPLPLIAISDYVVRHTLRQQPGPVVGALLGQQNGREISIEFAYEVKTIIDGDSVKLDVVWFEQRLEQMKIVHKDRNLDLVGWYTLLPRSGPGPNISPIHTQILERNESAILLGLHAEEVGDDSVGGKLPVTLYETIYEVDGGPKDVQDDGEDKEMKDGDAQLKQKFREIPFSVETGEAEMISMSSVAAGATNALSAQQKEHEKEPDTKGKAKAKAKGKGKEVATDAGEKIDPETVPLSKEDEEMVSAIQTKINAIKMLKSRIDLIIKYLEKLPPPYMAEVEAEAAGDGHTEPSQTLLRLIQALVHRLSLVEPADAEEFKMELLREENDVQTIRLLNELMGQVNDTRDVGRKFSAVEAGKAAQKQHGNVPGLGHGQLHNSMSSAGDLL